MSRWKYFFYALCVLGIVTWMNAQLADGDGSRSGSGGSRSWGSSSGGSGSGGWSGGGGGHK